MSNYFDNKTIFAEPQVNQYSSHMVMTDVNPDIKTKYINIDTKFRNDYNSVTSNVNFNIDLNENIGNVLDMKVESIELPVSYYNISSHLENNYFKATVIENGIVGDSYIITLSENYYTNIDDIITEINQRIDDTLPGNNTTLARLTAVKGNNKVIFYSNNGDTLSDFQFIIDFAVDKNGNFDKYNFKSKLGWLLGFIELSYNTNNSTLTYQSTGYKSVNSENFNMLPITTNVLYLVIDDFSNGKQSSFNTMMSRSRNNNNIIAKIVVDKTKYGFGSLCVANGDNGFLISDKRKYNGKNDIRKLSIQLVDEYDRIIHLNGLDFTLTIKLTHQ
jgi:hypothetical protein